MSKKKSTLPLVIVGTVLVTLGAVYLFNGFGTKEDGGSVADSSVVTEEVAESKEFVVDENTTVEEVEDYILTKFQDDLSDYASVEYDKTDGVGLYKFTLHEQDGEDLMNGLALLAMNKSNAQPKQTTELSQLEAKIAQYESDMLTLSEATSGVLSNVGVGIVNPWNKDDYIVLASEGVLLYGFDDVLAKTLEE